MYKKTYNINMNILSKQNLIQHKYKSYKQDFNFCNISATIGETFFPP